VEHDTAVDKTTGGNSDSLGAAPVLEMRNITKRFPGVLALNEVSMTVRQGEIHALVGENGAGKSTLMKVLSGVYPFGSYEGDIVFEGEIMKFRDIRQSESHGIVIIHQEFALIPGLSIAENLFLGHERHRKGVINWQNVYSEATALLKRVGLNESPKTLVGTLGVGKQQLVEIAKALAKDVKLLILDEPTSSLTEADSQALLDLLVGLRSQGISSVLISHKLNEIAAIADTITVIRDGASVESIDATVGKVSEDRIIRGMVGRDLHHRFPPKTATPGDVVFEVRDWTVEHPTQEGRIVVDHVNVNVRAGEVVGIAGLMGAGRTELAMSIFGGSYGRKRSGTVVRNGKEIDTSTVPKAIANKIAYVTEDRKTLGLVLGNDIKTNISLANLAGISRNSVISKPKEINVANGYRDSLRIKSSSVRQASVNLSGGNQQKVVLAKWLFTDADVLILDEPTRGIDVGAKFEIYSIINQLAAEGKALIIISSELPEILGVTDRIYVMDQGEIVGELTTSTATQESVMECILRHDSDYNGAADSTTNHQ
jgi:putative multiple sugar transport system ATP-binding protein